MKENNMKEITLKVSFSHEDHLKTFLRLLDSMRYCGDVGHSAAFNVGVDGDGRFRMDVTIIDEFDDTEMNLRDLSPLDTDAYERSVKNFHKWCPDSKCELAFGFE